VETNQRIRILVADDHPLFRDGIVTRISTQPDMEVVAEAADGVEVVERYFTFRPDVTLLDLQMPKVPGLAAIKQIRERDSRARIIVLTSHEGDVHAVLALQAGAAGYLLKTALRSDLLNTIRSIHSGHRYVEPKVAQEIAVMGPLQLLTERELAVLRLVASGASNKQVGRYLKLGEETVKMHLKSIFIKLEVNDRTHAVTVALKRGLIEL